LGETGEVPIVAGMRGMIEEKDLMNRRVVVVANLKKAVLRGEISCGMILAANDSNGKIHLINVDEQIAVGTPCTFSGHSRTESSPPQITINEFSTIPILSKSGHVTYDGLPMEANGIPMKISVEDGIRIR
jgi:tRNA-binding EMAP/Myf-like protein